MNQSDSSLTIKERAVFDSINSRTFKHAHQLIAKQLKKYPNDVFFHALDAYLAYHQGREETYNLIKKAADSGPTDFKTVDLLADLLRKLGKDSEAISLYENLSKRFPKNEFFTIRLFWENAKIFNYSGLQKSSKLLNDNFNKRNYKIWVSLCCLIALKLSYSNLSNLEIKLFPLLGLKLIQSLKPLKNSQEIFIEIELLKFLKRYNEIFKTVKDFNELNNNSNNDNQTVKEDLELQLIVCESLELDENWLQLFEYNENILNINDDWNRWKQLVKSSIKLNDDLKFLKVFNLIKNYKISRNSLLANIELTMNLKNIKKTDLIPLTIFQSIEKYLEIFDNKLVAFEDLKHYITKVDFNKEEFINDYIKVKQLYFNDLDFSKINYSQLIQLVNLQKFKFLLIESKSSIISESFISESISFYNKSKHLLIQKEETDYHPGDEFILLSINSILINNNLTKFSIDSILKCIILLEFVSLKDKHQFYVKIWLIKLYLLIGSFKNSSKNYESLSIKNIQNDLLSNHLFQRISTLMPIKQQQIKLNNLIYHYSQQDDEFNYFLKKSFEKESYCQIEGFFKFGERIEYSIQRKLLNIENVRISRLNGIKFKINGDLSQTPNDETWEDNRDFKIIWDCADTNLATNSNLTIGPIPKSKWIKIFSICNEIINNLLIISSNKIEEFKLNLKILEIELFNDKNENDLLNELTLEEIWSCKIILELGKSSLSKGTAKSYKNLLSIVSIDSLPNKPSGLFSYKDFHWLYSILEISNIIHSYCLSLIAGKNQYKPHSSSILKLKNQSNEITEFINNEAQKLKNQSNSRYLEQQKTLEIWGENHGISTSFTSDIFKSIRDSQDTGLYLIKTL